MGNQPTPPPPADDDETPWRTPGSTGAPLNGPAPKKYSDAEIDAAVNSKPAAGQTASKASGEPQMSDYPGNPVGYNLAYKKWAAKQVGVPGAGYKSPAAKSVSSK